MSNLVLNKNQYIKLKNLSYRVYMMDRMASSSKAQRVMSGLLEEYDNEELKSIVYNTLLFPFDVELYSFLKDKEFSDTTIQLASDKFDIPEDVVKHKFSEYVQYSFMNSVNEGLINYSVISELSKQLLKNDSENEKNQKAS